jgi:hypothetical protein
MLSDKEIAANNALREALQALQRARELCERADYGSMVLGPLFNAQRDTQYAFDSALGRN